MEREMLQTTGKLRSTLLNTLAQVKDGTLDLDKARTIVKVAAQVNESLYAETKAATVAIELGHEVPKLGTLNLGE